MLHRAAAEGFKAVGDAYERGRPGYPPEAVTHLVERLGIGPGSAVVEIAAGTGKLTRALPAGADIIAVEPVADMRRKLEEVVPGVRAIDGTAEDLPLPAASADAVLVAQAFHWFRGEEALRAIHRVLKPGGGVGVIWNVSDRAEPWVAELWQLIDRYEGDVPRYASGRWREAFDASSDFTPLDRTDFRHAHEATRESVVDRVLSISFIAALPTSVRAEVASEVGRIVADLPDTFPFPYRTDVFTCSKR